MEGPNYPPYYGGSTPFSAGAASPADSRSYLPRGQSDWAQNLAGLGALPQAGSAGDWMFTLSTLAGAGIGGGLVGWVAAKRSKDAAKRGAVFSMGLTGVADGFRSWSQSPVRGAIMVGGGLTGIWWVLRKL